MHRRGSWSRNRSSAAMLSTNAPLRPVFPAVCRAGASAAAVEIGYCCSLATSLIQCAFAGADKATKHAVPTSNARRAVAIACTAVIRGVLGKVSFRLTMRPIIAYPYLEIRSGRLSACRPFVEGPRRPQRSGACGQWRACGWNKSHACRQTPRRDLSCSCGSRSNPRTVNRCREHRASDQILIFGAILKEFLKARQDC